MAHHTLLPATETRQRLDPYGVVLCRVVIDRIGAAVRLEGAGRALRRALGKRFTYEVDQLVGESEVELTIVSEVS